MESIKNQKSSIELGKQPTKSSESFPIEDDLVMYLYDAGDNRNKYVRVDFNDYSSYANFYMIMDRPKLKGLADFILKYLENN